MRNLIINILRILLYLLLIFDLLFLVIVADCEFPIIVILTYPIYTITMNIIRWLKRRGK